MDKIIQLCQRFSRWLKKDKSPIENTNIVHCAIVVEVNEAKGQVLIAEAMPGSGIRIVDLLKHESYQLRPGDSYEYEVMRSNPKQEKMAVEAARIANLMEEKASYLNTNENSEFELCCLYSSKSYYL